MKNRKLLFAAWSCHNKSYYAYQTWDAPLRKIFSKVITFDPQEQIYKYGKEEMNKKFLELIEKEKPDYIFLWLIYEEFYIDTVLKIKEIAPNVKIINYCGDDDALLDQYSIFYSLIIDYFFVTHKEYLPYYKNRAFLSCATNTDQFKPLDLEKKYDVTFIGTPKRDRVEFVRYLAKNKINIKVFGAGWKNYPEFEKIYGGFLSPDDYTRVVNQTKINLNFTKNYAGQTHVIQRFFEINACRAFQLTEHSPRYAELFTDKKELVMFKTKEELLSKIKYYQENEKERQKIADSAYKRVLRDFAKNTEFKRLFKTIFSDEKKRGKQRFPKINKKSINLSKKDLHLSEEEIRNKLRNVDYISFKTEAGEHLKYDEYLKKYSLQHTEKDISCCDYYLHSKGLGDYMALYMHLSLERLKPEKFQSLLFLDQIMVTKKFFLKNIAKFRSFYAGKKINIINEKNTAFIRIPLVRTSKFPRISYEEMKKISWPKFENTLKSLSYRKKLFSRPYLYKILKEYLFGKRFMLNYILERGLERTKLKRFLTSSGQA